MTTLGAKPPYRVLFLCTRNAARSIMAEAMLNRLGAGRFVAFSAGAAPAGEVDGHAIRLLRKLGYETSGLASKSWAAFAEGAARSDLNFVFTLCDAAAGEACPAWPGQPITAHWGIPDPAAVQGSEIEVALAFGEAYRMLANRIGLLVNLPISKLDRVMLQARLDRIGAPQGARDPVRDRAE